MLVYQYNHAPLFEDSICDGSVNADTTGFNLDKIKGIRSNCLPAFSVVTAPDFFPQVDNFDLTAFDVAPGSVVGISSFYEGGLASLATARLTPNPLLIKPNDRSDNQTYTAVQIA